MTKVLKWLLYCAFITVTVLFLLEISYRFQLIDFYSQSFQYLNKNEALDNEEPDILVIGDSFSAHANCYIDYLRKSNPELTIVNASVPGTGIKQQQLILENRLRQYHPQKVLLQVYIGNDLTDIEHPINFSKNGFMRNVYWAISDRLLILPYMNRILGRFKSHGTIDHTITKSNFSVDNYTNRCKLYLNADEKIINDAINVDGALKPVFINWLERFTRFKKTIPQDIDLAVLIIPHCSQVNATYQNRFESMGAKFDDDFQSTDYPFVQLFKVAFPDVEVINPMKELKEIEEPYYVNDPHLSPEGQLKLFEAVTKSKLLRSTSE